jgi:hypothetical protein
MADAFFSFFPDYVLIVVCADGTTLQLTTMTSCSASLVTANGVGEMHVVLSDPFNEVYRSNIHAMDKVALFLKNKDGAWGPAWRGFVDTKTRTLNPNAGNTVTLLCTSPYKLWEIISQRPADVQALNLAYATGIAGAAVLQYSAQAVSYPLSSLIIDPFGYSGASLFGNGVDASNYIAPAMQTWSAVIQSILADTGLEFFFDERGYAHWRRVGYLASPTAKPVDPTDMLQADLSESDQSVVTYVEVRYTNIQQDSTAGFWLAPPTMETQLRRRRLTIYAPWIASYAAAYFLAQTLGQQYAANVNSASITIPADPLYQIGSVIEVLPLDAGRSSTLYYVNGITYNLTWGGSWVMTLALSYGRPPGSSFPYGIDAAYPQITASQVNGGFYQAYSTLRFNPDHPRQVEGTFSASVLTSTPQGIVYMNPSLGLAGSVVLIRDSKGNPFGSTANGYYTVEPPPAGVNVIGQNFLIGSTAGTTDTDFTLTVVQAELIVSGDGTSSSNTPSNATTLTSPFTPSGSGFSPNAATTAQTATELGQQYYWFLQHGATATTLDKAVPGDLVFYGDMTDASNQHVGFYHKDGLLFSAENSKVPIKDDPAATFACEDGILGPTHVLAMKNVSIPGANPAGIGQIYHGVDCVTDTTVAQGGQPDMFRYLKTVDQIPSFVGRYLPSTHLTAFTGITSAEITFCGKQGMPILLIYSTSLTSAGGIGTTLADGQAAASDAVAGALSLAIPANGTLCIYGDIEAGTVVTAAWIEGWHAGITAGGFLPGLYLNPNDPATNAAYTAAYNATPAMRVANGSFLYSSQPENTTVTPATFSPLTCDANAEGVVVWQWIEGLLGGLIDKDICTSQGLAMMYTPPRS